MMRHHGLLFVVAVLLVPPACGGDDGTSERDVLDATGVDAVAELPPVGDDGGSEDPGTVSDPGPAVDPGSGADLGAETITQAQRYLESDEFAADVDQSLPIANTAFAVKLFKEMNKVEGAGTNLFISPLSISTALAMVYQGATGETRDAIAATLEYEGIDMEVLGSAWRHLILSLENVDDDVVLAIADSVWMDEAFAPEVKKAFLDAVVQYFESELYTIDFQGSGALEQINGWVEDNTNGRIQDLLDQIPADAVMYLINALYFRADWLYPFDPEDTFAANFTLANGSTKSVDMMKFPKLVTSFAFTADDDYCAVRLPYGRDKVAFYGFIPWSWEGDKTVEDFISEMTPEKLEGYIEGVAYPEGEGNGISIWLPKFKIEYKKLLNEALEALGMGPAFTLGGFDGIAPGIGISRVIHQTFIEVDEKGTEAAAATAVEMNTGITPNFIATQPFFFVIRDDRTGTILFMGKVADPS
jgi:serpin B